MATTSVSLIFITEMSMLAPKDLGAIHKNLFNSICKEIAVIERKKSKSLSEYEHTFFRSYPKTIKKSNREELLRACGRCSVILVGDFHTFRQSQKGFFKLLEEFHCKNKNISIALECFQQNGQIAINEYLGGLVTLDELREKTDFEKYWPFSWTNYREILEFARIKKIPINALNISEPASKKSALSNRDHAAAEVIVQKLEETNSKIFVLYGELHLAKSHLPNAIHSFGIENEKILIINQNQPHLYWLLATKINSQKLEVIKHNNHEFCIMNSVPWIRQRSYLDWLEGGSEDSFHDTSEIDVSETTLQYTEILREALQISSPINSQFEIQSVSIAGLQEQLTRQDSLFFRFALGSHRTAPLVNAKRILVPTINTNTVSEAASMLLWLSLQEQLSQTKQFSQSQKILLFFFSYLGSKLLNPKRKCSEMEDLRDSLRRPAVNRTRKKIFRHALCLLREQINEKNLPVRFAKTSGLGELESCRLVGFILADRFFLSLFSKQERFRAIKELFSMQINENKSAQ